MKGETELALLERAKQQTTAAHRFAAYSARAGGVDPGAHDAIKPYIPKTFQNRVLGAVLLPVLRNAWRSGMSPTKELGEALTGLAMGDAEAVGGPGVLSEGFVLPNSVLRRLGGLD